MLRGTATGDMKIAARAVADALLRDLRRFIRAGSRMPHRQNAGQATESRQGRYGAAGGGGRRASAVQRPDGIWVYTLGKLEDF